MQTGQQQAAGLALYVSRGNQASDGVDIVFIRALHGRQQQRFGVAFLPSVVVVEEARLAGSLVLERQVKKELSHQ